MLYRIKAGDRESQLKSWSIEAVKRAARRKIWDIRPGERVEVFCGSTLVYRIERVSILDGEDRQRFAIIDL